MPIPQYDQTDLCAKMAQAKKIRLDAQRLKDNTQMNLSCSEHLLVEVASDYAKALKNYDEAVLVLWDAVKTELKLIAACSKAKGNE